MRIVLLGANGMVGFELARSLAPLGEVFALDRRSADLADPARLGDIVAGLEPDVIVNAAAYTQVDAAETDHATADRVNGDAVARLVEVATLHQALLMHYSTDYVFDGSGRAPWLEDDATSPVNAYGRSKLRGERFLADSGADWLCMRTSWIVASRGRNFVRTILGLAENREELRVIDDQFGTPTTARNIADVTAHVLHAALAERREGRFRSALLHYASAGETTWYGVAREAIDIAKRVFGDDVYRVRSVLPIVTNEFPTPARRPSNSRLCTDRIGLRFGISAPHWKLSLARCIEEMHR